MRAGTPAGRAVPLKTRRFVFSARFTVTGVTIMDAEPQSHTLISSWQEIRWEMVELVDELATSDVGKDEGDE